MENNSSFANVIGQSVGICLLFLTWVLIRFIESQIRIDDTLSIEDAVDDKN